MKNPRQTILKACLILVGIGVVLTVLVVVPDYLSYRDIWMPRGEVGSALATINPLKTDVEDAIAAGKVGDKVFAAPRIQPNPLGTIGGIFDDHGAGALTFSMDASSPKTRGAQIVLQRDSAGKWTCIVSNLDQSFMPKNCRAGAPNADEPYKSPSPRRP